MTVFSIIGKKYLGFCKKHSFNPILPIVLVALVIAVFALLLIKLALAGTDEPVIVNEPIPGKVTKIELKDVGELATQAVYYTNVQTIRNAQELWGWKVPFTETHSIFSYDGVIKIGYDFAEIEIEVNEETKEIRVCMPEAKILSNEVDEYSMRLYDEEKNIFTPMGAEDYSAERIQIKEESEAEAIERGVFDDAQRNAETLIKGFLSGIYDMNEYTVIFICEEQE